MACFLKKMDKSQNFRIKIAETVKANCLALNYDKTVIAKRIIFYSSFLKKMSEKLKINFFV